MDITKEYIDMCTEAFKDLGDPTSDELGNFWAMKVKDGRKDIYIINSFHGKPRHDERYAKNEYIPIYRQDQLQEISFPKLKDNPGLLISYFRKFLKYMDEFYYSDKVDFTSMEQLWLAFAMYKKYSKQWTGKEWVT